MIAFLIIAHNEPELLRRLTIALAAPWARCFVHIDRKVDIAPFLQALADLPDVTFIVERVPVYWGGWSQVQCTLNLIQGAMRSGLPFMRFVLLSGSCYPIRNKFALHEFLFAENAEYLNIVPMPDEQMHKPLSRLTKWHFEAGDRVPGLKARVIRLINRLALRGPSRRVAKHLGGYTPHAGSQWWALTREAVETVMKVSSERVGLVELFRYSMCPDESFFHTVLANSQRRENIRKSLTFTDWSDPAERPCLISERHLLRLVDPTMSYNDAFGTNLFFFARKFSSLNAHLLDSIDIAIKR